MSRTTAARWLDQAPELAPDLATALGEQARRLAAQDGGPADGWRAAFEAHAAALVAEVRRRGLHLGPPLDRAVGARSWPMLDDVTRLGQVHGRLTFHALQVDDGEPVGLIGETRPGDPLVDVACLLRLPDPALRALAVEASGAGLDPDALRRLEVYVRVDLLVELLEAPDDPDARALHLERVRLRLDEPGLVPRLVGGGPRRLEPDHPVIAARRALESSGAVRGTEERAVWLGALGAALLGASLRGYLGHRLGAVARELAARLPGPKPSDAAPNAPDPGFQGLAERGVLLLEEAVGAPVLAGIGHAAQADPALEAASQALGAALHARGAPAGEPLPEELLEAVADDGLLGGRAVLPAIAWAAQVVALRGEPTRGRRMLADALQRDG